jgi:Carboxypeptidase regulatory-like domain
MAFALSLAGQTSRGTLSGIISDSSGAVIGAARIELQNVEQNLVRTGESNATGIYRFDAVDPGNYRITVSLQGFKTFQTAAFPIAAAQVLTQDVRLGGGRPSDAD